RRDSASRVLYMLPGRRPPDSGGSDNLKPLYSPGLIPGVRPRTGITEPCIHPPVVATEIRLDEPLQVEWKSFATGLDLMCRGRYPAQKLLSVSVCYRFLSGAQPRRARHWGECHVLVGGS